MIPNGKGVGGMLLTLLTNPAFVLRHAITEPKVLYMLKLFGPLLFLSLLAKGWRWLFLYGLAFITLATREPVFSFGFQCSTVLLPFVFITFPVGLARLLDWFGPARAPEQTIEESPAPSPPRASRAAARAAVVFACLGVSAALSWKYGAVGESSAFRGGFLAVTRELDDTQRARFEWLEKTKATIDPKASVGVSNRHRAAPFEPQERMVLREEGHAVRLRRREGPQEGNPQPTQEGRPREAADRGRSLGHARALQGRR